MERILKTLIFLFVIGNSVFLLWPIVQAQGGTTEIISKRTENSKTYLLGYTEDDRAKYSLDSSIGAIHYKDNYADPSEQWKDIDLTWKGNKITKAPYELTLEGKKIIVRDKKTGKISTIELLDAKPAGMSWEIAPENTRVSFRHILPNDKVPFEAKFRVTGNIPLKTRAFDDEGEISLETTFVDNILTEKLSQVKDKETGKARPVKGSIKIDPTLDLQVGASANDGYVAGASTFNNSATWIATGYASSATYHSFFRFTGITIAQNSTIDVAYISLYEDNSAGTPLTKISADDQNNPAAVATYNDYFNRTLTTNGIDMDGDPGVNAWYDSPSIVSVIQELVNSYDYSNQAIQIMHKDDGSTGTNYRQSRSYNNTTAPANTWGPKLHIEYSEEAAAAAGGSSLRDFAPATRYYARPEGTLDAGVAETTISLETDELATCKYSTLPFTPDYLMPKTFANTGGRSHSDLIEGLNSDYAYKYYVKCIDERGNANPDDFLISFQTAPPPPEPPATSTNPTSFASTNPTLFAALTAEPSSGQAPLYAVYLTANVSGTAMDTINYIFYCNRFDSGIDITPDYIARYNSVGFASQKSDNACNYLNPGNYYPKVIVERNGLAAEDRIKITVTEKTPQALSENEKPASEMNVEKIKNEIIIIQQKIIELMQQIILLLKAGLVDFSASISALFLSAFDYLGTTVH